MLYIHMCVCLCGVLCVFICGMCMCGVRCVCMYICVWCMYVCVCVCGVCVIRVRVRVMCYTCQCKCVRPHVASMAASTQTFPWRTALASSLQHGPAHRRQSLLAIDEPVKCKHKSELRVD